MLLIELAAQGVKGCSPTARAALKPGYIVLQPPGTQLPPLAGLASALLYSDGRGEESVHATGPGAKVALTLQGNDLVAYRLLRELGGAGALHRLNKATSRFEEVTRDTLEITQLIRSQAGAPQKSVFEYLFTLTREQLPSRRPKKAQPDAKAGPKLPALATALPVSAATDVAEAQRKLQALEHERALSHEIDQLQFKQDGLASQLFELESKLQNTEGLKLALKQAEEELAAAPTPESHGLPRDIISRCERYPTLAQKKDEALQKLQQDREAEETGARQYIEPLWRDWRFLGGIGVGLALLAAAVVFRDGVARYLALLDIPAFGFAALIALKWVDDLQGLQRAGRKGGMLAAREKKVQEDFEAEAQHVKSAMRALGVESAQDVIDVLARKTLLSERVEALRGELQHARSNPELATAQQRYTALKAESDAITHAMQERSGGYVRDAREVERELARVRESIDLARSGGGAPPAEGGAPEEGAPGQQYEDPSPILLSLASDLFAQDLGSVAALLKDRCAQYLSALTDRRYQGAEWDHKGAATLTTAEGGVPATDLSAKDADLYFLALRLTLVEKYSAKGKLPFLIEGVIEEVAQGKGALMARMLKHLGTLTQVIHVTADPAFAPVADAAVSV